MSNTRRIRNDPSAMVSRENSVWDVYNNLADIRDSELIKDWTESLNFLLIFAAIFSAVLTALIVESMKLLQEDPQDATNSILLYMSSQLANNTLPAYQSYTFQAPQYAVAANALLFASLCCSLLAALAAVLALQWVNEYDARIDAVEAQERALIRHLRFLGVGKWKFAEIIAFLPHLLHTSVFLFFAGIVTWLFQVNIVIFCICMTGMVIAGTFYIVTAILAAIFSGTPFRSPMSRAFRSFGSTTVLRFGKAVRSKMEERNVPWFRPIGVTKGYELVWTQEEVNKLTTLMWTIKHVELVRQSTHRLVQILKDGLPFFLDWTMRYPGRREWQKADMKDMWLRILDCIAQAYIEKAKSQDFSAQDLEILQLLASGWTTYYFERERAAKHYLVDWLEWEKWPALLKLLGPLTFKGTLSESQVDHVVIFSRAIWSKNGEKQAGRFVEVIQSLTPATDPSERRFLSYSIDSLSIYLCTGTPNNEYLEAAKFLAQTIAVPPGQLYSPIKPGGTPGITLAAIFRVAFPNEGTRHRQRWTEGHPFYQAAEPGEHAAIVDALHHAITSRIAATIAQATSISELRADLRLFCRLLAYTPSNMMANEDVGSIRRMLENENQFDPPSPALTSVVWLHNVQAIPRIHEYLGVFLSCRRKFPDLEPPWRHWGLDDTSPFTPHEKVDQFKADRRLTEVLVAFDRLVADGCSTPQHTVMVQLVIDDLSNKNASRYPDYYTSARKKSIRHIRDSALHLVGSRAASIGYTDYIPSLDADEWRSEPWIQAMTYWCETYTDIDISTDEALLLAALTQPNVTLHSSLYSSRNVTLQNRLRMAVESTLREGNDPNLIVLAHTTICTTPWFPAYMTDGNLVKLIEALQMSTTLELRFLPLASTLLSFINSQDQLEVILGRTESVLTRNDSYPVKGPVKDIAVPFESMLRGPPRWLQTLQDADSSWQKCTSERLYAICGILRAEENAIRALLRWNGWPSGPAFVSTELSHDLWEVVSTSSFQPIIMHRSPPIEMEVDMPLPLWVEPPRTILLEMDKRYQPSIGDGFPTTHGLFTFGANRNYRLPMSERMGSRIETEMAGGSDGIEGGADNTEQETDRYTRTYSCSAAWDIY